MEEKTSSVRPFSVAPLWLKVLLGAAAALACVFTISKHGLRSWDWTWSILFLGVIFFDTVRGPFDKNVRWPWQILFFLWIIVASVWFVHFWGWVPALAFAGMAFVNQKQEKWLGGKAFLAKPQSIIFVLSGLTLVIWFARDTGGWVPTFCVGSTFFVLEGDTSKRRPLVDNLKKRSFVAVACVAAIVAIWASLHPSFGNIAGLVAVIALGASDLYLHTEEHQLVLS